MNLFLHGFLIPSILDRKLIALPKENNRKTSYMYMFLILRMIKIFSFSFNSCISESRKGKTGAGPG